MQTLGGDRHDGDEDDTLCANGVDATSGAPLLEPLGPAAFAKLALGEPLEDQIGGASHLSELRLRRAGEGEAHYGVKAGVDPTKLEEAGWAVVFPAVQKGSREEREQDAIRERLSPLLELRRSQATRVRESRYREYRGELGYRPGETKQRYLARLGVGPGPANPDVVPYYLLIVAPPHVLPYHVQHQLDVQYAVGRISFDDIDDHARYAESVVRAETSGLTSRREIAFVGVSNPNDRATALSRKKLVEPLAGLLEAWTDMPPRTVSRYLDGRAGKATLSALLGGERPPPLLFTASHGAAFPKGHPRQLGHQGALVTQDWAGPGSGPLREAHYLSAADIPSEADLTGTISFVYACYGAGTPELDDFSKQAFKRREPIAERPFAAALPGKMLSLRRGALASVGHVERTWGSSFVWNTGSSGAATSQLSVFEGALRDLMSGKPVGLAMEHFNARYAELASDLARELEELDLSPAPPDERALAAMWTATNDARAYVITGDPAVRLSFAEAGPSPEGGGAAT